MDYVIIGNSAAGIAAVEAIRAVDSDGSIILISDEPHHAYSRPLISDLLSGHVGPERMGYRGADFYERHQVRFIGSMRAEKIEVAEKKVFLSDGSVVSYDKLLLATGGTPFVPNIPGRECDGVFTFTKWSDAEAVLGYVQDAKKAVVIGGGLIGMKAAESLYRRELHVTVVELAPHVLSTALDETACGLMEDHLRGLGLEIITETSVEEVMDLNGRVCGVRLANGDTVECDLLLIAIGVRPNTELAQACGIAVGRGIPVNERMETSADDVYAAGDVVEAYDKVADQVRPIPIWPLAVRQGKVAGANMAGGDAFYDGGFVMNSIEVLGLPTISAGDYNLSNGGCEVLESLDREGRNYKKMVLRDGKLIGYVLVNVIDRAGIYTGLIKDAADVTPFKDRLLAKDFAFVDLPPDLREKRQRPGD